MGGWRKNALGGLNTIVRGVALLVAAIFGYDLRYLTLCSLCSFRAVVQFGGLGLGLGQDSHMIISAAKPPGKHQRLCSITEV